jgi:hypothetical protein
MTTADIIITTIITITAVTGEAAAPLTVVPHRRADRPAILRRAKPIERGKGVSLADAVDLATGR